MKPTQFDYERPVDLSKAVELIERSDITVRALAGGQSLVPMLNMRLAQPDLLVDLTRVRELRRVDQTDDAIIIGACVTHADIEDRRVPDVTNGALPSIASGIAYRAVRNRGTIGGSLAHGDPSADWLTSLAAFDAEVLVRSKVGQRRIAVDSFLTGAFQVAIGLGELVEAVRIPRVSKAARWGYYKACRKTGEFAQAIGAVLHDPERDVFRAVLGATESAPIVIRDAEALFGRKTFHGPLNSGALGRALDDVGRTDSLDKQVHFAALKRAIQQAGLS